MPADRQLPARGQVTTTFDLARFNLPEVSLLGINSQLHARPGLAPHTHSGALEICYLIKGEITFSVGGRDYQMKGNEVFWTSPDETHSSGFHAYDKSLLYWTQIVLPNRPSNFLCLAAKNAWPLVQELRNLPLRKFRGHVKLKGIFEEAFLLCREPPSALQRLGLASLMVQWLKTIIECSHAGPAQQFSGDITAAIRFIDSQLLEPLAIPDLAAAAGLSESRFKTKFREQMGIPPGEYVMRRRVQRAKEMLETTGDPITDIAYSLGFSSSQYFANVFRRFNNAKPSDVRRPASISGNVRPKLYRSGAPRNTPIV